MMEVSTQWDRNKSLAVKYLLAYKKFNKIKQWRGLAQNAKGN